MEKDCNRADFEQNPGLLDTFALLDDSDISASVKVWMQSDDYVLSDLCRRLVHRHLFKITLKDKPFDTPATESLRERIQSALKLKDEDVDFYLVTGKLTNHAYIAEEDKINILFPDGRLSDISIAADILNIKYLSRAVEKYYICHPVFK